MYNFKSYMTPTRYTNLIALPSDPPIHLILEQPLYKRYGHSVLNFFISIVICFLFQMSKVKIENDTTDGKSLLSPKTEDTSNDAETKPSPMESAQSSPGIPISTPSSTPSNAVAVPSKPRAKKSRLLLYLLMMRFNLKKKL
jgi:hypothetical protein